MSSLIAKLMERLFPKKQLRALMLGFDSGGRTTALYKMKLGEVVTTMPTIGFNLESVEYSRTDITIWDVGGRDKIRPLWRHYFQGTDAVIFVVNSDRGMFEELHEDLREELHKLLSEDELRDAVLLVWANKQDLLNAVPVAEIEQTLGLHKLRNRTWHAMGTTATTGEGLQEGMEWIVDAVTKGKHRGKGGGKLEHRGLDTVSADAAKFNPESRTQEPAPAQPSDEAAKPAAAPMPSVDHAKEETVAAAKVETMHERTLLNWLERADDEEATLLKFQEGTLEEWDHRERLLVSWSLLRQHGRSDAMRLIFDGAKKLLQGRFHESTLYFWVHMVHYAVEVTKNPLGNFQGFVLLNPQLADSNLILDYYSQSVLWQNEVAMSEVVLPDKKVMPSLLSSTSAKAGPAVASGAVGPASPARAGRPEELSDEAFLKLFEQKALPAWGHEPKLRAIYVMLRTSGRRKGGTDKLLAALQGMEGGGYNLTLAYFWVQMVTYFTAVVDRAGGEGATFAVFIGRSECKPLLDTALVGKHYSESAVAAGASEFTLPDRKPLPSLARR